MDIEWKIDQGFHLKDCRVNSIPEDAFHMLYILTYKSKLPIIGYLRCLLLDYSICIQLHQNRYLFYVPVTSPPPYVSIRREYIRVQRWKWISVSIPMLCYAISGCSHLHRDKYGLLGYVPTTQWYEYLISVIVFLPPYLKG